MLGQEISVYYGEHIGRYWNEDGNAYCPRKVMLNVSRRSYMPNAKEISEAEAHILLRM